MRKILTTGFMMMIGFMMVMAVSFPAIVKEMQGYSQARADLIPEVDFSPNSPVRGDVSVYTGEDILGMIIFALRGDYDLVVDGILIEEGSDLESVNFRGLKSQQYNVKVDTNVSTGKRTILANVVR